MYDFIDITERQGFDRLSSVAMEYDGYLLENEIRGYRTLTVKGREMLDVDIDTENPSGRNGAYVVGQSLPPRELVVTYMLRAESNEEFQVSYSLLMKKLLKQKDVKVRFADQQHINFYGRYSGSDSIPEDRNWVVSSFTIFCQDPYKYGVPLDLIGDPSKVGYISHYGMKPDEIKLVIGSPSTKITVDNVTTGRHIILNGTYVVGDVIKIKIPDNTITKNGQNIMNNLDPQESDFHSFLVHNEDTINVTPNSTMTLTVRGRTL